MILGIIYERVSNTPVGYVLSSTLNTFTITLYSTDGYVHDVSKYKKRPVRPSGLYVFMDKSIPLRYEVE